MEGEHVVPVAHERGAIDVAARGWFSASVDGRVDEPVADDVLERVRKIPLVVQAAPLAF